MLVKLHAVQKIANTAGQGDLVQKAVKTMASSESLLSKRKKKHENEERLTVNELINTTTKWNFWVSQYR